MNARTILVSLLILFLTACVSPVPAPPTPDGPMDPQCVDFYDYEGGTHLGEEFEIDGISFTAPDSGDPVVVDVDTDVHGLMFDWSGIRIELPGTASTVTLHVGAYAADEVVVRVYDSGGARIGVTTVPADDSIHSVALTGERIKRLGISGGGGQGVLVAICINPPPEASPVAVVEAEPQCVDFSDLVAGQQVDPSFDKEGFVFRTIDGDPQMTYQTGTPGELGLHVDEDGVEIGLPGPASRLVLRIVSYYLHPLQITAYNSGGDVVAQVTAPAEPQDTIHTVELTNEEMTSLVMEGGGNEGVLVEICVNTEPEVPAEPQCLDFSDLVAGLEVGPSFEKDGFVFSAIAGDPQRIYQTDTPGELALRVNHGGVEISLPRATARLAVCIESHNPEPLQIVAYNSNGDVVAQVTAPGEPEGTLHCVEVSDQEITSLVIEGGEGEGLLVEICIDAEPED